jgi:hypothetical protein
VGTLKTTVLTGRKGKENQRLHPANLFALPTRQYIPNNLFLKKYFTVTTLNKRLG